MGMWISKKRIESLPSPLPSPCSLSRNLKKENWKYAFPCSICRFSKRNQNLKKENWKISDTFSDPTPHRLGISKKRIESLGVLLVGSAPLTAWISKKRIESKTGEKLFAVEDLPESQKRELKDNLEHGDGDQGRGCESQKRELKGCRFGTAVCGGLGERISKKRIESSKTFETPSNLLLQRISKKRIESQFVDSRQMMFAYSFGISKKRIESCARSALSRGFRALWNLKKENWKLESNATEPLPSSKARNLKKENWKPFS